MKIINVIPIAKGVFRENLSYFSLRDIKPGALVTIPLRNKKLPAIVSSVEDAKNLKTSLKKFQFRLKPIKFIKAPSFLLPEFLEACREIADYFISPLGMVIKDFIPQAILESANFQGRETRLHDDSRFEIILMQAQVKERLQYYKGIIREEFAKGHSVFFCLATTADIKEVAAELQRGIEKYSAVLYGKMPVRKMREVWEKTIQENHPLLIIATPTFLSIPRKDIKTIIVDRESSPSYKLQKRPYIDIRKAAEIISKKMNAKLILGDSVLRTESFFNFKEGTGARITSSAEQIIIDMNKKDFILISDHLKKIIREAYDKKEKIILFVNRRGYGIVTFCKDCLRPILCGKCETPLVLHRKNGPTRKINFICHKCLSETTVLEQCPYCKSWNLETTGIGIQKVVEEVKRFFPHMKIFRMDSDVIKNEKQGKEIFADFINSAPGALIGTEIIFSFIRQLADQPVDRVAIVSIDSLFTLPDFRINEKIFHLLLRLRLLAKKTFLIQTRLAKQHLFDDAIRGNISDFYKTEIENRKAFHYPPFQILIKLTIEGKNQAHIKKEIQKTEEKLKIWAPTVYPAFIPKIKNIYTWHILLKIEPATWPHKQEKLHQILSSLPPYWKINIDPESLL